MSVVTRPLGKSIFHRVTFREELAFQEKPHRFFNGFYCLDVIALDKPTFNVVPKDVLDL
jgi:hypothetical protein